MTKQWKKQLSVLSFDVFTAYRVLEYKAQKQKFLCQSAARQNLSAVWMIVLAAMLHSFCYRGTKYSNESLNSEKYSRTEVPILKIFLIALSLISSNPRLWYDRFAREVKSILMIIFLCYIFQISVLLLSDQEQLMRYIQPSLVSSF